MADNTNVVIDQWQIDQMKKKSSQNKKNSIEVFGCTQLVVSNIYKLKSTSRYSTTITYL